jgi:SRSO17 transposase
MTREMGSSSPQSKTAERHGVSPPGSLAALLGEFRGCFSAWTFPVFCALACGLISQTAGRTVCGMLVGAGLSQTWSHHRAHRFFSHARWSIKHVSAVLTRLVVRLLLADDAAVMARRVRKLGRAGHAA